ncbi:hypothetical protein [Dongshaea marina]|uniref:hypothetical protein n=1 Tax=Dongshaea marina TaxID=2047966 RepID=UPI000D3E1266|nr:hypothetical protein [Dongshaea marina]
MAKPKFRIGGDDYFQAKLYLDRTQRGERAEKFWGARGLFEEELAPLFKEQAFRGPALSKDLEMGSEQWRSEYNRLRPLAAEQLTLWCEKHLNSEQWRKLKTSLRVARARKTSCRDDVQITLKRPSYITLSLLAELEGCSLSETIDLYLEDILRTKQWQRE